MTIADPIVRAWATKQALESSDSVYLLTASTIVVDDAHRRLAIDSITVTTDTARNLRLPRPHPAVTLRLRHCAVTGIDLTRLAAAHGLHALHAGCDSAAIDVQGLVPPTGATSAPAPADSNNFLRFQGKLDLPAVLPLVSVDVVTLPHVHVVFAQLGDDGRRNLLAVDSVAFELDSVRIDPHEAVSKRRPLFSRDISVRLDRFASVTKDSTHIALDHLVADLEDGTCRLDALTYDVPRHASVSAQHLSLAGVQWRTFLLTGNIAVSRINLDTTVVHLIGNSSGSKTHRPAPAVHLESTLRGIGRAVRIDSLSVKSVRIVELPGGRSDSSNVTTVGQIRLAHLAFGVDSAGWNGATPLGGPTLAVDHLLRHTPKMDIAVQHLRLDAPGGQLEIDSLHAAPRGDDSAYLARTPYRKARLSVGMARILASGIDLPAFIRRGALRTRALDVRGLVIDVFKDKNKPEDPAPNVIRRFPQGVLRDGGVEMQVDTITGAGLVTYRERDEGAAVPGTLTFGAIQLHGYNFSTDPTRMSAATPFRLIGDARLMGAGAMHVEWDVPLLAKTFEMTWHGSLGQMDPKAMNAFLADAVGMKFTDGNFEGATWDAVVSNGVARGKVSPRWHNLHVDFPGVQRGNASIVGGVLRGVVKLAANTFGIRGDNDSTGGGRPIDGSITHHWINIETLPQFIWFELRDPLLLILKK